MATYRLEVFQHRDGHHEPVLLHRRDIQAPDEQGAIEKAKEFYATVPKEAEPDGFVLYDGKHVVYEQPRKIRRA